MCSLYEFHKAQGFTTSGFNSVRYFCLLMQRNSNHCSSYLLWCSQ